jgi:hypothetical protein
MGSGHIGRSCLELFRRMRNLRQRRVRARPGGVGSLREGEGTFHLRLPLSLQNMSHPFHQLMAHQNDLQPLRSPCRKGMPHRLHFLPSLFHVTDPLQAPMKRILQGPPPERLPQLHLQIWRKRYPQPPRLPRKSPQVSSATRLSTSLSQRQQWSSTSHQTTLVNGSVHLHHLIHRH